MSLESLHGIRQVYKNSTVFLYAMKEQLESKLLKKYIIASNSMNYLGIHLKNIYMQDLCAENYKMLIKF